MPEIYQIERAVRPALRIVMNRDSLRADLLMLLAALIWGCSFVVQRLSLATIGPFLFNGVRFVLGALVVALLSRWLRPAAARPRRPLRLASLMRLPWAAGTLLGVLVAVSIGAQQIGLAYTKVANAGFISSMYVVIVPIMSLLGGQRLRIGIILGALCAAVGLYYLSGEHLTLGYGDALELLGAVAISLQVILLGALVQRHDPLPLAMIQVIICALISLGVALAIEPVRWIDIERSAPTILYAGGVSIGIGYPIQAIAQRRAPPEHAAIVFSMEGVFAALAARLIIDERLSWPAIGGCVLVVLGCVLSQLAPARRRVSGSSPASSPSSGR